MAPWFDFLLQSSDRHESEAPSTQTLHEAAENFGVSLDSPDDFAAWAVSAADLPACLVIPVKGKKAIIAHNVTLEGNSIRCLSGFHATAPVKSIAVEDIIQPAVYKGVARTILTTKVPSLGQMLQARTPEDLLSMNGDSEVTVEDLPILGYTTTTS